MSENTADNLDAILGVAMLLEAIEADLGLSITRSLLIIALTPGLSINDLAEQLRVPQQTASRYVAILQGRYQSTVSTTVVNARNPLISLEISQHDPRRRALFLTPDGKKRIEMLIANYSRDNERPIGFRQS